MKRNSLKIFTILSSILLVLALGVSSGAVAQKGGKGGGHGNGHGNGNGNGRGNGNGNGNGRGGGNPHAGGNPYAGQPGGWQMQRQIPQQVYRPQIRQPQVYRPPIQVYQPRYDARAQKQAWKQEKQAAKQERKAQKVEQRVWQQQPQVVYQARRQGPPPWAGVWNAPGRARKEERRIAKEERKAEKFAARIQRQYDPGVTRYSQPVVRYPDVYYTPQRDYSGTIYRAPQVDYYPEPRYEAPSSGYYSYGPYSYDPYQNYYPAPQARIYSSGSYFPAPIISGGEYYYPEPENDLFGDIFGGSNWTEMLLGTVLNALLGGEIGGREFYAQPSYESPYEAYNPYDTYSGYPEQSAIYGIPGIYGQRYGTAYPTDYGYSGSAYHPVLFSYPTNVYDSSYIDELTRRAYNSGYEQGFLAGQAARYNSVSQSYYHDPYFFDDAGYGYGAYSISMNRQRRWLSEGYERGYQDALQQNNQYDALNGGNVDLVSLMLSSVLGMFNI